MDVATFEAEAEVEDHHWWFVGRRQLFAREIARLNLDARVPALDIGTSTGTNLRLLRDAGFANVTGLDSSPHAIAWCREKGFGEVLEGDVCSLPFPDASFDLVLATDVIEHVEEDAAAMREIRRVLRPGGRALMTVPAFPGLWGLQDEMAHHKRRYYRSQLVELAKSAGFTVERSYYFNYLLLLPILLARMVIRAIKPRLRSENDVNTPILNRVLELVFRIDVATAPTLRPPFGVSALAVLRKTGE